MVHWNHHNSSYFYFSYFLPLSSWTQFGRTPGDTRFHHICRPARTNSVAISTASRGFTSTQPASRPLVVSVTFPRFQAVWRRVLRRYPRQSWCPTLSLLSDLLSYSSVHFSLRASSLRLPAPFCSTKYKACQIWSCLGVCLRSFQSDFRVCGGWLGRRWRPQSLWPMSFWYNNSVRNLRYFQHGLYRSGADICAEA